MIKLLNKYETLVLNTIMVCCALVVAGVLILVDRSVL